MDHWDALRRLKVGLAVQGASPSVCTQEQDNLLATAMTQLAQLHVRLDEVIAREVSVLAIQTVC